MKKIVLSIMLFGLVASINAEAIKSQPVKQLDCWRFDLERTGVSDTQGVSEKKGEKWRTTIGTKIVSSPVLSDGIIYVGANTGFYALDATSGKEVWKIGITKKGEMKTAEAQGVESSACIADGFVYFTAIDGHLYSVNAKTGEIKWKVPTNIHKKAALSSPAVAYGVVFIKEGGFDVETGKLVWETSINNSMGMTAGFTMNSKVHVGFSSNGDSCLIFTIEDGILRHKHGSQTGYNANFGYSQSTPTIVGDKIYGSAAALVGTAPRFPRVAIWDMKNNKVQANCYVEPHLEKKNMKVVLSSTTVWDGKIYVGCDSGYMYVFDDQKAEPMFKIKTGGPVRCSASISSEDGILYFSSYDGLLYAADARTGKQKWTHKLTGPTENPTWANSCPWVEDGVVYIGTFDGDIVAIH